MCTATAPNRQKPIQSMELPSSAREKGLELFGEAARELGEQGPAQYHRDNTHQGASAKVVPARESAVVHGSTEAFNEDSHRVELQQRLYPVRNTTFNDLWRVHNRRSEKPHLREDLPQITKVAEVNIGCGETQRKASGKQCKQEHLQQHNRQPRQEDASRNQQGNGEQAHLNTKLHNAVQRVSKHQHLTWERNLLDQRSVGQHAVHPSVGYQHEKVPRQQTTQQIQCKYLNTAIGSYRCCCLKKVPENKRVDSHSGQRVEHGPRPAQNALAILRAQFAQGEVP